MTKTGARPTAKQVAQLSAWFLVFGLGVLMIEVWVGDHPFRGSPASWGLGETFSVMGGAFLCGAALRHRQQR
jgi:hypothetical protein